MNTLLFSEKMSVINGKLDLLDAKENLIEEQKRKIKSKNSEIVTKNKNKPNQSWPFESYYNVFILIELESYVVLPTAMILVEFEGVTYGPVRAFLDTGAQMNLITSFLADKLELPFVPTEKKRLMGIDGEPFEINRKSLLKIRPWFYSDVHFETTFWILPEQSNWQPVMPAKTLNTVHCTEHVPIPLADPEYFAPESVHILLVMKFFAKIMKSVIGTCSNGATLLSTDLGAVVMGTHQEDSLNDLNTVVVKVKCPFN